MIKYRIPLTGLKVSTNKIYGGIHWTKRKEHKDSILSYAQAFCKPIHRVESYPIEIHYRFTFGSRALDTLNCAFMAKMFEDAMCALGIIEDDNPKFVSRSILESVDEKAKEDWLEITINQLNKNVRSKKGLEKNC